MTSKLKCSCSKCTFSTQQSASSGLPDKGYISYRGLIAKTSCKSLTTFAAFWFVSSILCPRALNRHCIITLKAMKHIPDCLSQLTNKIWIVWIKPRYHCCCSFVTFVFVLKNYTLTFLRPCCELARLYWHTPRFASARLPAVSDVSETSPPWQKQHADPNGSSHCENATNIPQTAASNGSNSSRHHFRYVSMLEQTVGKTDLSLNDAQGFVEINHGCIFLKDSVSNKRDLFRFHWQLL